MSAKSILHSMEKTVTGVTGVRDFILFLLLFKKRERKKVRKTHICRKSLETAHHLPHYPTMVKAVVWDFLRLLQRLKVWIGFLAIVNVSHITNVIVGIHKFPDSLEI